MGTVREQLEAGRRRLADAAIESPAREAALLLRTLLGMSEAALLAHDDASVPPAIAAAYAERIDRRARHTPAAYLTGEREFYGRSFRVDERVLIPRPETERLVEIALELPLPDGARVLELACGSGCVAVTLAAERPAWTIVATDLSPAALAVARRNAIRHGVVERIQFVAADLARGLDTSSFDLALANPPYIAHADRERLAAEIRDHEPALALFAEDAGLHLLDRILRELTPLPARAWLACEHGAGQREALVERTLRLGGWSLAGRFDDLAGIDRNLLWRRTA